MGAALFSILGLSCVACSEDEDGTKKYPCENPVPAGAGYERCQSGSLHRARVEECASALPRPDTANVVTPTDGSCTSDLDCVDRPHGYCGGNVDGAGTACLYGCVKDSECGPNQICVCGDPVGRCADATCTEDADCGAGFRCQAYDASHGCGQQAFACQTGQDSCGSDADCGGFCDGASGKFACVTSGCVIGRPFLVEGEERIAPVTARADWSTAIDLASAGLTADQRAAGAAAWARIGQMEHASVAAFARFALQLLQLGAPADLVDQTTRAMADETRHARLAFGIASVLGGKEVGPAALNVERSLLETSLVDVARLVVREGCIGETSAALEAREAAARVTLPTLAAALERVADDESRHAELAWRFVGWALTQAPQEMAALLRAELARGAPVALAGSAPSADELELSRLGLVPESLRRELQTAAFREIIAPCARALLERAAGKQPEMLRLLA